MFYLTKRVDEGQCNIGDECMVLADFSGIKAGHRGIISEMYDEGVMVAWYDSDESRQQVIRALEEGNCYPSHGYLTDGFSRDELEYLAFCTKAHPKVDPKVYNAN